MFSNAALTLFCKEWIGLEVNNSEMALGSLYGKQESHLVKGVCGEQAECPSRSRPSQRYISSLLFFGSSLTTLTWSDYPGAALSLSCTTTHPTLPGPHTGSALRYWLLPQLFNKPTALPAPYLLNPSSSPLLQFFGIPSVDSKNSVATGPTASTSTPSRLNVLKFLKAVPFPAIPDSKASFGSSFPCPPLLLCLGSAHPSIGTQELPL